MRAIHILKDGSRVETVKGIVINDELFYRLLNDILNKKGRAKDDLLLRRSG